ncbi:MAG: hypothetical protein JEZ10_03875 [Verrucomicrobia bacterium]|nr:hypothetical protein [Verrucomicrobiota bacterium]
MSNWIDARRLLWDDDEQILIVDDVRSTGPMKEAGKITVQPKASYCCGNSFRTNSTRRKDNVCRLHTWVIEFDNLPLNDQRALWASSDMPFTLTVFSGGKSVHCYIRTTEDCSPEQWQQIAEALLLIYADADSKVLKDRARLSRLPGGLRENGTLQKVETTKERVSLQTLIDWIEKHDVTKGLRDKGIKGLRDKEKLSPPPSLPAVGTPAEKIALMTQAEESYKRLKPDLYRLYEKLIERRFKAERGQRNAQLISMITFLHDAVSCDVAFDFARQFYLFNLIAFHDPLDQHLTEARAHWDALERDYPNRLTAIEQNFYSALADRQKTFFRICRSLAHDEKSEDGTFDLPLNHFGHRMNLAGEEVRRLKEKFVLYGLLQRMTKGTQNRTENGEVIHGTAGRYKWTYGNTPKPTA